jgi:hypothetical protein
MRYRRQLATALGSAVLLALIAGVIAGCGSTVATSTSTQVAAAATTHVPTPQEQVEAKKHEELAKQEATTRERRERAETRAKEAQQHREEAQQHREEAAQHHKEEAEEHAHEEHEKQEEQAHEYPAEVQHNFMISCTTEGGTESKCHCVLKGFEKRLSLEQLAVIEENMKTIGVQALTNAPAAKAAVEECQGA